MSARDDYRALASFASTRGVTRDSPELQAAWALAEIDKLRSQKERLRAELSKWGWGDFHYGEHPQDPAIVRLLEETT